MLLTVAALAAVSLPAQAQVETANVAFEDQDSNGTAVMVARVVMTDGGFIAIHNESLLTGDAVGSVVGVSEFLSAGPHLNVEVPIWNVPGGEQTLIAMPHRDSNGNEAYDFVTSNGTDDPPYLQDGEPITDEATVQVDPPSASVTFEDQSSGNGTVRVASTTMSRGGFVTIHDESLLDGDAFGSVVGTSAYLGPGEHTDVEVSVSGINSGTVTLIAMPHMDTDGDQTYGFVTSEGEYDGPYTEGDGAVTAAAQIENSQGGDDDAGGEEDAPAPGLLAVALVVGFVLAVRGRQS